MSDWALERADSEREVAEFVLERDCDREPEPDPEPDPEPRPERDLEPLVR